ncbi:MAG TPA: YihY/virulence factor BrkB family protein [Opitutaceae bacterium]|nr:YihY/virulence factor BrkB family protein [Opitutaceae bacterium]
MARMTHRWGKLSRLLKKEIWQPSCLNDASPRGRLYAVLRVISITVNGLFENKTASRAAALSFSSLLGLGPLVAIVVLVAGFMLDKNDPHIAVNTLHGVITFIAPSISEYEKLSEQGKAPPPPEAKSDVVTAATLKIHPAATATNTSPASTSEANPSAAPAHAPPSGQVAVNEDLVQLINGFIAGSRSGTAGVVGALTLILIVLQLFTSIENAFNEIWGVRRGRSLLMRIVFYWTVLTLGAVLFFAAVTALGASAFLNVFIEHLPLGANLLGMFVALLPSLSIVVLILVLMLFYRFIPNTRVSWRAALIGAVVVAGLLVLNNYLAFIYFRRVLISKSLYGSLGILPMLMFGLFIFWFFVLVGGQLSYAVQNVRFRSSQAAWHTLAESTRERLSLVVLLTISRRFQEDLPPVNASQLATLLKVSTQILNECLNCLVDLKFITPIPPTGSDSLTDYLYQPARPLAHLTLQEFKQAFDNYGADPAGDTLDGIDPIARSYREHMLKLGQDKFLSKPLDQLLADFPFDETRPPFARIAQA